jgi:hypothetical protein
MQHHTGMVWWHMAEGSTCFPSSPHWSSSRGAVQRKRHLPSQAIPLDLTPRGKSRHGAAIWPQERKPLTRQSGRATNGSPQVPSHREAHLPPRPSMPCYDALIRRPAFNPRLLVPVPCRQSLASTDRQMGGGHLLAKIANLLLHHTTTEHATLLQGGGISRCGRVGLQRWWSK